MKVHSPRLRSDDEIGRLCALNRLDVLDTPAETQFDKITDLVRSVLGVPVAAVSLIDTSRQWFKSIRGLDVSETPREVAFCDHTIRGAGCLRVPDATKDDRFADNPLVTGEPNIRAYLGAPIITRDRYALGSLCAIDFQPRDFTAEQARILASFADLVMNELELRQVAARDGLTGLANRLTFERGLKELFAKQDAAALIIVDLDRFKSINDTWGHPVGDDVLEAVSGVLIEGCPADALVARIGGEEFGILLPDANAFKAADIADTLRRAICAMQVPNNPAIAVSASFGIALCGDAPTPNDWMIAADAALYAAKRDGRNCVRSEARRAEAS